MNVLLLLGTAHSLQIGSVSKNEEADHLLKIELERLCCQHRVSLIAEEMSDEALRRTGISQTIGQIVASDKNIDHLFCDPPDRVRSNLGIRDTQAIMVDADLEHWDNSTMIGVLERSWSLRENYMLDRIMSTKRRRVLLICGATHVDAFCDKAESINFAATIAHRDWQPNNGFNPDAGKARAG